MEQTEAMARGTTVAWNKALPLTLHLKAVDFFFHHADDLPYVVGTVHLLRGELIAHDCWTRGVVFTVMKK